tara:strand:- start:3260 stop:3685 length:426 start_codon:yes stop_codon:yes gene_type:complete
MSSVNLDVTDQLDITAKRGDTFSLTLTLKDSAGTALTLSTSKYEFYFVVREVNNKKSASKPSIVLATPNISRARNTFESPTLDDSGNATFTASAQTMGSIASGSYTYEIQYRIPSSTSVDTYTTVLRGSFTLNQNILEAVS